MTNLFKKTVFVVGLSVLLVSGAANAECAKLDAKPFFSANMAGVTKYEKREYARTNTVEETFHLANVGTVTVENGGCEGKVLNVNFDVGRAKNYAKWLKAAELDKKIRELISKLPPESDFSKRILAALDQHLPALLKMEGDSVEGGVVYSIRDQNLSGQMKPPLVRLGYRSGGDAFYLRTFQPAK